MSPALLEAVPTVPVGLVFIFNLTDRSIMITCVTLLKPWVQIETVSTVPIGLVWIVEV